MLIHYFPGASAPPPAGTRAACGARFRGIAAYRADLTHKPCPACTELARCECGELIGAERTALRLTRCFECARAESAPRVVMHANEDTGRVEAEFRPADDIEKLAPGRTCEPLPESPKPSGRDRHGRFFNARSLTAVPAPDPVELGPAPRFVRDTDDPTRIRAPYDYWCVPQVCAPIPGHATTQAAPAGAMRERVRSEGSIRPNPWDRKPRDRGRRDFESPTSDRAIGVKR